MNFVFWAGASFTVGTGHIMRLVPIAEQLVARGYSVSFLTSQIDVPWVRKKLNSLGPGVSLIDGAYIPNPVEDILLVDSYKLDSSNDFFSKNNWLIRVSVGDDNTPDYGFEVTVLPSFNETKITESSSRIVASGRDFFLFRSSIRNWRNSLAVNKEYLKKIIVSGGGTDPTEFGPSLIKFFDSNFQGFEVILFSNSARVEMHSNVLKVIEFGESFDQNVKDCYLAFCPSSTMAVELAAAGIPVGIGLAVQNQAVGHSMLDEKGLACPIGSYEQSTGWKFDIAKISHLLEEPEYRDNLSSHALEFFNLDGAFSIADLILSRIERRL
jgi:spore coat polysaccharide biosynthesis predicted glycosyltransferase SpsG